ncbi:bifunctional diaminohydroxyphosphoribosylaminopyrimidine deaminase/5-amino-6-(5-phosphoribosylamino)uracil reductase RibD [Henriciella sp. AS95]|uniref:bifunctional diaminohydroxyphosphoribosylaminopyrimidine deaminase/5-amino-6-(5-phosphoribosylamino)uracil reductase RibD n=1 Tax=Henriciella sp. AS95 TaxID=3135782 RepID=UPI00317BCF0A
MKLDHETYMRRAIALARVQHGRTGKNPAVGCVIVGPDGKILSEGATGDEGRPHAEQLALSGMKGKPAIGAVAYVTLEPCRERSTGEDACSRRLIDAGVAKVFVSVMDLHPQGTGGKGALEDAGVPVETGLLESEAAALYEDFFASLD